MGIELLIRSSVLTREDDGRQIRAWLADRGFKWDYCDFDVQPAVGHYTLWSLTSMGGSMLIRFNELDAKVAIEFKLTWA